MLIIPVAAVFNWMEPLLVAAFIGAPTFAWLAHRYRWQNLLTGRTKGG
jgi:hypothetical protein